MKKGYLMLRIGAVVLYAASFGPVYGVCYQRHMELMLEGGPERARWQRRLEVVERAYAPMLWLGDRYPVIGLWMMIYTEYCADFIRPGRTLKV